MARDRGDHLSSITVALASVGDLVVEFIDDGNSRSYLLAWLMSLAD